MSEKLFSRKDAIDVDGCHTWALQADKLLMLWACTGRERCICLILEYLANYRLIFMVDMVGGLQLILFAADCWQKETRARYIV